MTPWEATFGPSIECVFLDVGGVLLHDEPVELYFLSRIAGQLPRTRDLFRTRERLLSEGDRDWINSFGRDVAGDGWDAIVARAWDATLVALERLCVPCDGALEAVAALAGSYRLCCVANQPAAARAVIRTLGFEGFLEHVLFDTEVHVSKPNPEIFRMALELMKVEAGQVVFVGDRLDNDIAPARQLGMRTVWLRRAPRHFVPAGVDAELAAAYYRSLERVWHHNGPGSGTATADLTGEELAWLALPRR